MRVCEYVCLPFLRVLSGGKHDLGFLFFFELMTSTLKFQILKEDSTYALGSMLLRMMPPAETNDTNALMSLLRLMSLNPQLCLDRAFPRWKDTRTFKLSVVFAKQSVFAELFKGCRQYLEEKKNKGELINSVAVEVETRAPLLPGPLPMQVYFERAWIAAASTASADVSCAKRYLNQTIDGVAELEALTTMPLSPIGLGSFLVHKSRADRGLAPVSPALPLDLSNHRAMNSHVAQTMLARLRNDIKYYAEREAERMEPFLSAMQEADIQAMVDAAGTANPKLDAAIAQLRAILVALQGLQQRDHELIQQTMLRTLVLANKVDIVLPPNGGASLSAGIHDVEGENRARSGAGILLARISGTEATISFELLVASLLNSASQASLQRLNPYLKADDVNQILDMTTSIVMHCSRLGHSHRAVSAARDLLAALIRLKEKAASKARSTGTSTGTGTGGATADELATELASQKLTTFQSLYSQSQSLAQLLVMKRYYITAETSASGELLLSYDPRFLVFEFMHNILLRRSQVHLVNQYMKRVSEGKPSVINNINASNGMWQSRVDCCFLLPLTSCRLAVVSRCLIVSPHQTRQPDDHGQLIQHSAHTHAHAHTNKTGRKCFLFVCCLVVLTLTQCRYVSLCSAPRLSLSPLFVFVFQGMGKVSISSMQTASAWRPCACASSSSPSMLIFSHSFCCVRSIFCLCFIFLFQTTVVGPLLALLLADSKSLVIQVVPRALLEFSRSTMRGRFSALIRRHIYTFQFDRFSEVTGSMYKKFVKVRRGIAPGAPARLNLLSIFFLFVFPLSLLSFPFNMCHCKTPAMIAVHPHGHESWAPI